MGPKKLTKNGLVLENRRFQTLLALSAVVLLASCSKVEFEKGPPVTTTAGGPVVCGPFEKEPTKPGHGLVGDLYALSPSQCAANEAACSNTTQYIQDSNKIMRVEMSAVNVPTRNFSSGFDISSGKVKYPGTNTDIVEWFGLKLRTQVQLSAGQTGGKYQFALLADDGVILRLSDSGSLLISDNQIHPSKVSCSNYAVDIQPGQKIPMELEYFQGPRTHIAVILLWRKMDGDPNATEPECTRPASTDNYYFDSANGSAVLTPYSNFKARGWTELTNDNFILPAGETNQCT
jgi:hypothetical protein